MKPVLCGVGRNPLDRIAFPAERIPSLDVSFLSV